MVSLENVFKGPHESLPPPRLVEALLCPPLWLKRCVVTPPAAWQLPLNIDFLALLAPSVPA